MRTSSVVTGLSVAVLGALSVTMRTIVTMLPYVCSFFDSPERASRKSYEEAALVRCRAHPLYRHGPRRRGDDDREFGTDGDFLLSRGVHGPGVFAQDL